MARRYRQRAKSEMNVVPYIDVMLVLLVIFMITAPLLNQAVEVSLPYSDNAETIDEKNRQEVPDPLVVSIDKSGAYYIDRADDGLLPVTKQLVIDNTRQVLSENPNTPVYIRADKAVDYGAVMVMMDILKNAGVKSVALITKTSHEE